MEPINNEKIGQFIAAQRKALSMTQKELGDRLFVSDKTVSKWERGASLPNVALLQPLAEVLAVSVSELLNGETQTPQTDTSEQAVAQALQHSLQKSFYRQRRFWALIFASALLVVALEAALLFFMTGSTSSIWPSGLFLLFAGWLCLFAKPWLPTYYDNNRISFVQQGPFRMNMVGLRFNNRNWPPLLTLFRCATLSASILYPLVVLLSHRCPPLSVLSSQTVIAGLFIAFLGLVYAIGKKYE